MRKIAICLALLAAPAWAAGPPSGGRAWCGTTRDGARDAVWAHREEAQRRGRALALSADSATDVGQIAVLRDEGDLALVRNPLDLQGAGLRFERAGAGYSVTRTAVPLVPDSGTRLSLSDDDTRSVALPFSFPFFGSGYSEMFVNSDGNLTFGSGDSASTSRSVGRLVSGPPRIAPLLADLDPGSGGSVSTLAQGDRFTVAWTDVPQFGLGDRNSFQVTLSADGRIEFSYGANLSVALEEGVVGIAPGAERAGLTAVDFANAFGVSAEGAMAESFRDTTSLDAVATARKFYATHGDDYQGLLVFTSTRLTPSGTFAYELTVKNSDRGIGDRLFDASASYGSAGRLESFALMDAIGKYPDNFEQKFLGEDSALAVVAHEVGHRWLAKARFRTGGTDSGALLGRDDVHWSFFFDSDGSHLEGNDIEDLGGGRFRTGPAGVRYGALDQYLMGLRPAEEVPPFFYVESPTGAGTDAGRDPEAGVAFGGVRRDVTIADVIASLGSREPAPAPKPAPWRQAFVYVAVGGPADPAAVEKVERLRAAWEAYFARSTEGRLLADSRLN